MPPVEKEDNADPMPYTTLPYTTLQLGVWRILRAKPYSRALLKLWWHAPGLPLRFVRDVFSVKPGLFFVVVLSGLWISVEPIVSQHFFTCLLHTVSNGLVGCFWREIFTPYRT